MVLRLQLIFHGKVNFQNLVPRLREERMPTEGVGQPQIQGGVRLLSTEVIIRE
jgi:hypothetical protein